MKLLLTGSLVLECLLLLNSCSHFSSIRPTSKKEALKFWEEQRLRNALLSDINSKISVRYQGLTESLHGKGRLLSQGDTHLRLEIRDVLGRLQFLSTLNGDNFTGFYPTKNLAYLDETSGKHFLNKMISLPFSISEVFSYCLGILPQSIQPMEFDEWGVNEGVFWGKLTLKNGVSLEGEVGPNFELKSLLIRYPDEMIKIQYDTFEPCCENFLERRVSVARFVRIQNESEKTFLELSLEEVKILKNRKAEHFTVQLGVKTRKIHLMSKDSSQENEAMKK